MNQLTDKIREFLCPHHYEPYLFLCIEENCLHEQRFLCSQCAKLQRSNQIIETDCLFQFLKDQYIMDQMAINKRRSALWQQFQRYQEWIKQMLHQIEQQMDALLNSIFQNQTINKIKLGYFERELELEDIGPLGSLFCDQICSDPLKQFQFKEQQIDLKEQNYVQTYETLDKYQLVEQVMREQLNINQEVIDKHEDYKAQEQRVQQVKQSNYRYKTISIKKINKICQKLQFNHDETSILATCREQILLFELSKESRWIQSEQKFNEHQGTIQMAIFNHNSTEIVSCGEDLFIVIWKKVANQWTLNNVLDTHTSQTNAVCFNNDSTLLASVSVDNTCGIHVIINGVWQLQQKLECTNGLAVCFNHNSTLLAAGGFDAMITIWALNQQGIWKVKQHLIEHISHITKLAFNSQSTQLLSSSFDQTLKIWQADEQGIWVIYQALRGHTSHILDFDFNYSTNVIVSCSVDKSLKIWKIDEYNQWTCIQTINSHKEGTCCCILSNDCSMIVSGAKDNTIMIHSLIKTVDNNAQYDALYINNIQDTCRSLCFNKDETQIVAGIGRQLIVFNISQAGELMRSQKPLFLHMDTIWEAKFNHNSTLIASCSNDSSIIIWDKFCGKWTKQEVIRNHGVIVYSICFNHNSTQLASGNQDGTINIYKLVDDSYVMKQVLKQHTNSVYCVTFNQDSTQLVSASGDKTIMLWEYNGINWIFYSLLFGHTGQVITLFLSQNSTQLLSGSDDKSIKFWQINDQLEWNCKQTLIGHNDVVQTVLFNKFQDMIVSSSEDHTTKIWKQINGTLWECIQTLDDQLHFVYCTIINNDSSRILSGSADQSIVVYKRKTQK